MLQPGIRGLFFLVQGQQNGQQRRELFKGSHDDEFYLCFHHIQPDGHQRDLQHHPSHRLNILSSPYNPETQPIIMAQTKLSIMQLETHSRRWNNNQPVPARGIAVDKARAQERVSGAVTTTKINTQNIFYYVQFMYLKQRGLPLLRKFFIPKFFGKIF